MKSMGRKAKYGIVSFLVLAMCAAVMAGCSASQSGDSRGASGSSSASASGSESVNDAFKAQFVGTWDLVSYEQSGGASRTPEQIAAIRESGTDMFMNLEADGSAVRATVGENTYGTWAAESATSGVFKKGNYGFKMILEGSQLNLDIAGSVYHFEKGEPKKALSEDEYNALKDPLIGSWHAVSTSMNGETRPIDDPAECTLSIESNGKTAFAYRGESRDDYLSISNEQGQVYLGKPSEGCVLSFADGVLAMSTNANGMLISFERD